MKNYHPHRVSLTVAGMLINSGFAEDEFITLEWDTDAVRDVAGVDGEVSASVSNDKRSTLTVKLMNTSDHNPTLEHLYNLRARSGGSIGVFPVTLHDHETGEVHGSTDAWISRPPDVSYAASASVREWKIRLANTELKYA